MIVSIGILVASAIVFAVSVRAYRQANVERGWQRWTLILGVPASVLSAVAVTGNRGAIVGLAGGLLAMAGILYASKQRWSGQQIWRARVETSLRDNPQMQEAFRRNRLLRRAMRDLKAPTEGQGGGKAAGDASSNSESGSSKPSGQ